MSLSKSSSCHSTNTKKTFHKTEQQVTSQDNTPPQQRSEQRLSRRKMSSVSFDLGLLEINPANIRMAARILKGVHISQENLHDNLQQEKKRDEDSSKTLDKIIDEEENDKKKMFPKQQLSKVDSEDTTSSEKERDWSSFENAYAQDLNFEDDNFRQTADFLSEIMDLLLDYLRRMNDRSTKVLDFHHPHQLKEALGHCLDIPDSPRDLEQVLSDCKETLKYGVKTGHPHFFNQLSSGLDIIALAGEWLTATANTNMFTYEIAPVFTLMEEVTLQKMLDCVGFPDGDGIFAPGGAISNLYAVLCARYHYFPDVKQKGHSCDLQLVLFTSEQAHYSIKRAAAITGIGTDNVVKVKCDARGKMLMDELSKAIDQARANGKTPFLVSATAGTTVLGAFDPLESIADICQREGIWMHVDCAWGGGVLVSQERKHLVKGIERSDSVTWNPHKAMGVTLQCSAILLKRKGILAACNSMHADYLFQQDKQYDTSYDTGDKTIQCGRHNDVFKLWLMWRAKGDEGFGKQIERLFELSEYLQDQLKVRPGYELVIQKPEYLNVCFWYIPKNLRDLPRDSEFEKQINKVAPKIKAMMMEAGSTMVGYQPLGDKPNFFRMIVSNCAIKTDDIDFMLGEIEKFGEQI